MVPPRPTPRSPEVAVELLRFATAGSVDDGKSTLIGRLLYDSKAIFEDQLEQVAEAQPAPHGNGTVDLALLTDGLRAEREQGITIDVAYRYFATPRRTFIIADTPGHVLYTRNMVTGASTADLAIVLVDARNGVAEPVAAPRVHRVAAADPAHRGRASTRWTSSTGAEERFEEIVEEFTDFAAKLEVTDVTFIPISALHGDNVVDRSANMPWYDGPPLLYHLEHVHIASDRNLIDPRFPVQWVIRPGVDEHHDYRGYAGQVASGILRAGDEVVVLPSGAQSTIAGIDTYDGEVEEAFPPMSVTVRLDDDLDVSRGDVLVPAQQPPGGRARPRRDRLLDERAAGDRGQALRDQAHHAHRRAACSPRCCYRIDVDTLHRDAPTGRARPQRHRPRALPHRRAADRSTPTAATARPAASS